MGRLAFRKDDVCRFQARDVDLVHDFRANQAGQGKSSPSAIPRSPTRMFARRSRSGSPRLRQRTNTCSIRVVTSSVR